MPADSTNPQVAPVTSRRFWLVLAGALLVHGILGADAARRWTPTHDEYWHLPYGLYYWQTGDLSADPINPPLVRMWAALPVLCSHVQLDLAGQPPTPYVIGDAFLKAAGANYRSLFFQSRLMILLLGLCTAATLAWLARRWSGDAAGMMTAVLWCGCPTLLAQSVVVTHDLALTAATVAVLAAFQRWRDRPNWKRTVLLGVVLGLAQLTKLTAVLLYPLCAAWWLALPAEGERRWRRELWLLLGAGLTSWAVLCAGYRFDGVGRIDAKVAASSPAALGQAALPRPYRLAWQRLRSDLESRHPIFLNGDWRQGGYPQYYAWALLYKLPPGTLIAALLAVWAVGQSAMPGRSRRLAAAAAVGFLTFFVPASLSSNQIGLRYILPAYPCLILLSSQATRWCHWQATPRRAWLTVLAVAFTPLALRYHPHHLAYFNEFAGGPLGGREHLVDSNIDWGQDLYDLARSLEDIDEPVCVAYFGSVPPHTAGLSGDPPPQFSPQPGWHAVSANFVQGRPHTLRLPDGRFDVRGLDAYGYFRFFTPRWRVGYSIDVYQLSPEDVARYQQARAAAQSPRR
jgi:hypothetical protein